MCGNARIRRVEYEQESDFLFHFTCCACIPLQLYHVGQDPSEQNNLLGKTGQGASDRAVGKANHLKLLLAEYMRANDGPRQFYTSARYTKNGKSLIRDLLDRNSWRQVDFWKSDSTLTFGPIADTPNGYQRTEYIYVGRTKQGQTKLNSVKVKGPDAGLFTVTQLGGGPTMQKGDHRIIRVRFKSSNRKSLSKVNAYVEIINSATGTEKIKITG